MEKTNGKFNWKQFLKPTIAKIVFVLIVLYYLMATIRDFPSPVPITVNYARAVDGSGGEVVSLFDPIGFGFYAVLLYVIACVLGTVINLTIKSNALLHDFIERLGKFLKPSVVKIIFVLVVFAWIQISSESGYTGDFLPFPSNFPLTKGFPLAYGVLTSQQQLQSGVIVPVFSFTPTILFLDIVFWYFIACFLSLTLNVAVNLAKKRSINADK